jgi:hypothetical protein
VEAHALRERGWSVPAIVRHLGRDRKTVRAYLDGKREPGRRKPAGPDRFAPYCRIRFGDDPHLWATTLFDEVAELGYGGSYPSFTRALRVRGLRPWVRCVRGGGDAGRVRRHRTSGGRGDPVGLGRAAWPAAVVGVGEERASAGRGAGALGRVARGARWERGAAVPYRGAARGL